MHQLYSHYFSADNIGLFYLAQHVEYHIDRHEVVFYNTLFDSLLFASMKDETCARKFVSTLEKGCSNVLALISECFSKEAPAIYTLMVQKKMIE